MQAKFELLCLSISLTYTLASAVLQLQLAQYAADPWPPCHTLPVLCYYRHLEWRAFWIGHSSGLSVLDYEERVVCGLVYLVVVGLLVYEGCRRCMGLAGM